MRFTREQKETITQAFTAYLDRVEESLVEKGLDDETAGELIFVCADKLRDLDQLPQFPANEADYQGLANWVVRAQSFDFHTFVTEKVAGALV